MQLHLSIKKPVDPNLMNQRPYFGVYSGGGRRSVPKFCQEELYERSECRLPAQGAGGSMRISV